MMTALLVANAVVAAGATAAIFALLLDAYGSTNPDDARFVKLFAPVGCLTAAAFVSNVVAITAINTGAAP